MLGPARFSHIETCAREVSHALRARDEVEESVLTLTNLDVMLDALRAELAGLTKQNFSQEQPVKKKPDYADLLKTLDPSKAKRLITARENSIKSVKASLKKAKESQSQIAKEATSTAS